MLTSAERRERLRKLAEEEDELRRERETTLRRTRAELEKYIGDDAVYALEAWLDARKENER